MQEIHFEAKVEDGYIKIPEKYADLNNKTVKVGIIGTDPESKAVEERIQNMKNFLEACSGMLKETGVPSDISSKDIKDMRLKDKYGI